MLPTTNKALTIHRLALIERDPDELLNDPNWEETTHPKAEENGHRTFENKATGEKLRYDEGTPGETGHKGESHWHRPNPDSTEKIYWENIPDLSDKLLGA